MKQSNLKVAITGLTIGACLLAGSTFATAKAGNWHSDSFQIQQPELQVMDTSFRVNLAKEKLRNEQESNILLNTFSPKIALMSVQITPRLKTITKLKPITAVQVKSKLAAPVKPKAAAQTKTTVPAKKTSLRKVPAVLE